MRKSLIAEIFKVLKAQFCKEVADVKITKALESHLDGILAIEEVSFSDPWTMDSLHYEINRFESVCLVAVGEACGDVLGFVTMRFVLDEGHILNIAVEPSARKKGIGKRLLLALFCESGKRGVASFVLEVRSKNSAAIALYEKLGFEAQGLRRNYYTKPSDDGIVMRKQQRPLIVCNFIT